MSEKLTEEEMIAIERNKSIFAIESRLDLWGEDLLREALRQRREECDALKAENEKLKSSIEQAKKDGTKWVETLQAKDGKWLTQSQNSRGAGSAMRENEHTRGS